jgi:septal ring factor EnvC (AmiA/AmiB activator)
MRINRFLIILLALITVAGSADGQRRSRKSKSTRTTKTTAVTTSSTTTLRSSQSVQKDKSQNAKEIKETQRKINENAKQTGHQINQLNSLNAEIQEHSAVIGTMKDSLEAINCKISVINDSINKNEARVNVLRKNYAASLRAARSRRKGMSNIAFVFSAETFSQSYRRFRYLTELNKWQADKSKKLKDEVARLNKSKEQLSTLQHAKASSLHQLNTAQQQLQSKQAETSKLVAQLQTEGESLKTYLADKQRKAQELNSELDRIIAEEARIAEERRKKEEARIAEEKRKREEARLAEERRKREEARIAEEKRLAEERRVAEEKRAAEAKQLAEEKRVADEKRQAEEKRLAENKRKKQEVKKEEKKNDEVATVKPGKKSTKSKSKKDKNKKDSSEPIVRQSDLASNVSKPEPAAAPSVVKPSKEIATVQASPDRKLTGSFKDNKGRLLFPVTGSYKVVGTFGRSHHPNLPSIEVQNNGIDIEARPGANARAVFNGRVSAVFQQPGYHNIVIIRHGEYLTVYAGLDRLSVKTGDEVRSGQTLGHIYSDTDDNNRSLLHFEVRRETEKLDPSQWVR